MDSFSANSAKSYLGRNVNLHLKDGAVIVNVHLKKLHKGTSKNSNQIEYHLTNRRGCRIPLRSIAYAEMLNGNVFKKSG